MPSTPHSLHHALNNLEQDHESRCRAHCAAPGGGASCRRAARRGGYRHRWVSGIGVRKTSLRGGWIDRRPSCKHEPSIVRNVEVGSPGSFDHDPVEQRNGSTSDGKRVGIERYGAHRTTTRDIDDRTMTSPGTGRRSLSSRPSPVHPVRRPVPQTSMSRPSSVTDHGRRQPPRRHPHAPYRSP